MDDNVNSDQPGCCGGSPCCPPNSGDTARKSTRTRTLTFVAVVLLAGAVASYSLFWRSDESASSACCPPGSAAAAACAASATVPGFDHDAAPAGLSVLTFLRATDTLSQQDFATIAEVRAALEVKGSRLEYETVRSDDSSFAKLADGYGLTSFPAFVVFGQRDSLILSRDYFRTDTILSVFVPAPSSVAPCNPSGNIPQ